MLPGPDQVIACPHCKGLARHMTLRSGNTFGAQTWTDGKQVAPMLPRSPAVLQCRHCGRMFWLAEAEEIGPILEVTEPGEHGYYSAIAGGLARDAAQEKTLRMSLGGVVMTITVLRQGVQLGVRGKCCRRPGTTSKGSSHF